MACAPPGFCRRARRRHRYAAAAGEAFQIADDLLNETSTPAQLGKAVGTDAARAKTSAVSVHGWTARNSACMNSWPRPSPLSPIFPAKPLPSPPSPASGGTEE
jgi:hypothetical protein